MNKSLLLIICDFLLISVLAMVEFKPNLDGEFVDAQELKEQAAEEMLELLQLSLEHENAQRREVEEALDETQDVLNQTRDELQTTGQSLEEVSSTLNRTEEEKAALASTLDSTRSSLQLTLEEKATLESSLKQNEERSLRLQNELRQQQQLAEEKSKALNEAQESVAQLETLQQKMATDLQILDTEKQMLAQNLVTAKAEVERARIEAERAQVRSESLAAGVSELAASSTALKEEFRQAQTLSMNAIYKAFEDNRIFIRFQWNERGLFSTIKRESAIQSVMIDTGTGIYAIFATANTPIDGGSDRSPSAAMKIGERSFRIKEVGFLKNAPEIAAIQVPRDIVEASGLQVFTVSKEPMRFSTAVLVSDDQELYGEIPVRIPPGESGYLEIQTRLFNRLFGEFSPSPGDYVFSMTGTLTGIMVRDSRARIISSPEIGSFRSLEQTTP